MEQSGFDACATMSNDFRVNMHDAYPRVYIDLSSVGFSVRFLQRASTYVRTYLRAAYSPIIK